MHSAVPRYLTHLLALVLFGVALGLRSAALTLCMTYFSRGASPQGRPTPGHASRLLLPVAAGLLCLVLFGSASSGETAPTVLGVNAGGPGITDAGGRFWPADTGFSGGSTAVFKYTN